MAIEGFVIAEKLFSTSHIFWNFQSLLRELPLVSEWYSWSLLSKLLWTLTSCFRGLDCSESSSSDSFRTASNSSSSELFRVVFCYLKRKPLVGFHFATFFRIHKSEWCSWSLLSKIFCAFARSPDFLLGFHFATFFRIHNFLDFYRWGFNLFLLINV